MHWKQQPRRGQASAAVADKSEAVVARQLRRERVVAMAVEEARAAGHPHPTAEAIAERFDLPVGLLQWMLPRVISQGLAAEGRVS